jgi:hypothetical protein
MTDLIGHLRDLASVDLFAVARDRDTFIGRPFYFDYSRLKLLVNDKWKHKVGGLQEGGFLLCGYDGEDGDSEIVLLRVLGPTALPTDSDVVASMVEYYKEEVPEAGKGKQLDSFTRYEFMFSGVECRVLGTFYRNSEGKTCFGADVENFYSSHNYSVFKPRGKALEYIVNFREDGGIPGGKDQVRIGEVRYSASRRHPELQPVPVYVSALDFIGKRTALFGMTRTGKSNTVKKLIQAVVDISGSGVRLNEQPLPSIGQIIFDINGEYANPNQQDAGTAIYDLYKDKTTRYSLLEKPGFKVMKVNFHRDIVEGHGLIQSRLEEEKADYVKSFLSIDLSPPDDQDDPGEMTRWLRLVAAYRATLYAAGFDMGADRITFPGKKEINELAGSKTEDDKVIPLEPDRGLSGREASHWFTSVWKNYETAKVFVDAKAKGKEWADDDLKAVLVMLTRIRQPGKATLVSGYRKLDPLREMHSSANEQSFEEDIIKRLRKGEIVIIDLSQGDPFLQRTYSDRICQKLFSDGMRRFIANESPNFIQFYFEEAHNLFPKKEDKDLTQIYNRIAKEGAKLRLGLVYATQEVSSISSNVLKNTQNWFVSHLNNTDELREIDKYYDYEDFVESLRRTSDRGFIRMKTYSNAFVVPVQIDRFAAEKKA